MSQQRPNVFKDFRALGLVMASTKPAEDLAIEPGSRVPSGTSVPRRTAAGEPPTPKPRSPSHSLPPSEEKVLEQEVTGLKAQLAAALDELFALQRRELEWKADPEKLTPLDMLESQVQQEQAQLTADRAAFEAELDELVAVKAREVAVNEAASAVRDREQQCSQREQELTELQASLGPVEDLASKLLELERELQTAIRQQRAQNSQLTKIGNELAEVDAARHDISQAQASEGKSPGA